MSSCRINLQIDRMRAKLRRMREMLPRLVALELKKIAEASIDQRYSAGGTWNVRKEAQLDRGMLYGRLKKLNAVFVPVVLKHVRKETWPDLQPIYDARITRNQRTYMGRRRFWVDVNKLDDLRRAQLARRFNRLSTGDWKISLKADFGDVQVKIWKNGRVSKQDRATAEQIVAIMEAMFAERASAILYQAMA